MWCVPVIIRLITAYVIAQAIIKKLTGKHSRAKRIALQFFICTLFALVYARGQSQPILTPATPFILIVGFANGIAAYCQWTAMHYSMSKNAVFTVWDDVIALSLGFIVLGERTFLNPSIIIGIILSLSAAALFGKSEYARWKTAHKEEQAKDDVQRVANAKSAIVFFSCLITYSVIWGGAAFSMRYYALREIGAGTFMASWYIGALMSMLLIQSLERLRRDAHATPPLTSGDILGVGVLSVFIVASLGLEYWALQLAPLVVIQPIFLVAELIIPALLGLYLFKERRYITGTEWFYFALAMYGGLQVGIGFSTLAGDAWWVTQIALGILLLGAAAPNVTAMIRRQIPA